MEEHCSQMCSVQCTQDLYRRHCVQVELQDRVKKLTEHVDATRTQFESVREQVNAITVIPETPPPSPLISGSKRKRDGEDIEDETEDVKYRRREHARISRLYKTSHTYRKKLSEAELQLSKAMEQYDEFQQSEEWWCKTEWLDTFQAEVITHESEDEGCAPRYFTVSVGGLELDVTATDAPHEIVRFPAMLPLQTDMFHRQRAEAFFDYTHVVLIRSDDKDEMKNVPPSTYQQWRWRNMDDDNS